MQFELHVLYIISSKVTRRGQTKIPRKIREVLRVKPGESLVYEVDGERVVLHAHPGVLASFGVLKRKGKGKAVDFEKARSEARKEWATHAADGGRKK